jgi:lipid II:glycine glycyltransferase (peptidoglycan interpeptide bridge formation enzyme)
MTFSEIKNKEQWDKKIGSASMSQFLQSWEWGEFQKRLGRQFWRLDLNGEYLLVIKMPLPLGWNYLYIPRTRIIINSYILDKLKVLAGQNKSLFIRIEPVEQNLQKLNFVKTRQVQPVKTLVLDLDKAEEQLLAEMHPKTRYNIRLAEKKGVRIVEGARGQAEQFPIFYDLLLDTFRRKEKSLHPREYYQQLYHDHLAKLYFAEYQGKFLCANMIIFYGDTVTYLHGGSSNEDRNIMAPHFLQWVTIKKAKALGYHYYDFWGIDENKWPGVTRFKKSYGGLEINYSGTWDLPINKIKYALYSLCRKIK